MASYEIPDPVNRKTYDAGTGCTFDITKPNGNDNAGKDLALSLGTDGKAVLAADGAYIIGKFLLVQKGDTLAAQTGGKNMAFIKTAATINVGDAIVGAGSGKVKSAPTNTIAAAIKGRGIVTKVEGTADGSVVRVDFL